MKIQKVFHISASPGIDGLIRISYNKQIPMKSTQHATSVDIEDHQYPEIHRS